jgi:hypothetical protein
MERQCRLGSYSARIVVAGHCGEGTSCPGEHRQHRIVITAHCRHVHQDSSLGRKSIPDCMVEIPCAYIRAGLMHRRCRVIRCDRRAGDRPVRVGERQVCDLHRAVKVIVAGAGLPRGPATIPGEQNSEREQYDGKDGQSHLHPPQRVSAALSTAACNAQSYIRDNKSPVPLRRLTLLVGRRIIATLSNR